MKERISELDHTYLQTEDDIFFCVSGNLHSREAIFGMPYYFLTQELEEIMDIVIDEFVFIGVRKFTKLLTQITLGEYELFIKDNYPDYYYSPPMWKVLMKVSRPKVRQVFDPRSLVRKIRRECNISAEEENPLLYVLGQMQRYDATLLSNVGVTGSVLLTQDYQYKGNDIDLVVYERSNIEAAKNFSSFMRNSNPRFSALEGPRLQQYVEKKSTHDDRDMDELYSLVAGRWDTIFVDDTKLDFTFADYDKPRHVQSFDVPEIRPVNIKARVTGVSDSYFLPTLLSIDHEEFDRVVITARGYICLFQLHDVINISGVEHTSSDSGISYLVVDDLKGGSISMVERLA